MNLIKIENHYDEGYQIVFDLDDVMYITPIKHYKSSDCRKYDLESEIVFKNGQSIHTKVDYSFIIAEIKKHWNDDNR